MNTNYAIPKHFLGALLSTGASVGMGLLNNSKQKKAQINAANTAYGQAYSNQKVSDLNMLEDYPEEGYGMVDYYQANGGKLAKVPYKTKGGELNPISDDMVIAKGNKHNESTIDNTSGIKLIQGNKPFAEIEDGETVKNGNMVFSDRLTVDGKNTYAETAEGLARKKSKIKSKMKKGDRISTNTSNRKLAFIDKKENELFMMQEASKLPNNSNKLAKGGFAKAMDYAMPFVDNITNAILTADTPRINKPQLQTPVSLKTDVNVNPQLRGVKDAVKATTDSVLANTSNSATARTAIGATRLAGAKQTGNILANKENTENQLINQERLANVNIGAQNLSKLNQYQDKNLARLGDMQGRISANVANLAGDFVDKRDFAAKEAFQKEQLKVIGNTYDVKGTTGRADLNNTILVDTWKSNPTLAKQVFETSYKGTPNEKAFLELMGWRNPTNTVNTQVGSTFALPNNQRTTINPIIN